jgi:hypothetical protein
MRSSLTAANIPSLALTSAAPDYKMSAAHAAAQMTCALCRFAALGRKEKMPGLN